MSEIALITTSPFSGLEQLKEVTIPSLKSQTCQDFTWYYLDGYYSVNKQFFSELAENVRFNIVHVPLMHATHYPHNWKWEPYNSALLLVKEPKFLRFGRFRKYHPKSVEIVLNELHTSEDIVVNFVQCAIGGKTDYNEPLSLRNPTKLPQTGFYSSCGMFAADTCHFINKTNGNDEVGLHWFHFEDVEMDHRISSRIWTTMTVEHGLIRYDHRKGFNHPPLEPPIAQPLSGNPNSIYSIKYSVSSSFSGDMRMRFANNPMVEKIEYGGFDFWYSEADNSLIIGSGDDYLRWIARWYAPDKSIIGLGGMRFGRNLAKMKDDISSVSSIWDRVNFITEGFNNIEYYTE